MEQLDKFRSPKFEFVDQRQIKQYIIVLRINLNKLQQLQLHIDLKHWKGVI